MVTFWPKIFQKLKYGPKSDKNHPKKLKKAQKTFCNVFLAIWDEKPILKKKVKKFPKMAQNGGFLTPKMIKISNFQFAQYGRKWHENSL